MECHVPLILNNNCKIYLSKSVNIIACIQQWVKKTPFDTFFSQKVQKDKEIIFKILVTYSCSTNVLVFGSNGIEITIKEMVAVYNMDLHT